MGDFLGFRKMITPGIIQILFWLGVLGCVIGGIGIMTAEDEYGETDSANVIIGILYILIGPIVVRVYCELLILFFRIFDVVKDMLGVLKQGGGPLGKSSCPHCGAANVLGGSFCSGCGKTIS
ncbi:MAG: DUF4282 domain-containing protein [Chloroflexi bacterium]|nr:DUF4282 domain-containing protein [Chloroflexota bacterium]